MWEAEIHADDPDACVTVVVVKNDGVEDEVDEDHVGKDNACLSNSQKGLSSRPTVAVKGGGNELRRGLEAIRRTPAGHSRDAMLHAVARVRVVTITTT